MSTFSAQSARSVGLLAGVGPKLQQTLERAGICTFEDVFEVGPEGLAAIRGVGPSVARSMLLHAKAFVTGQAVLPSDFDPFPLDEGDYFALDLEYDNEFMASGGGGRPGTLIWAFGLAEVRDHTIADGVRIWTAESADEERSAFMSALDMIQSKPDLPLVAYGYDSGYLRSAGVRHSMADRWAPIEPRCHDIHKWVDRNLFIPHGRRGTSSLADYFGLSRDSTLRSGSDALDYWRSHGNDELTREYLAADLIELSELVSLLQHIHLTSDSLPVEVLSQDTFHEAKRHAIRYRPMERSNSTPTVRVPEREAVDIPRIQAHHVLSDAGRNVMGSRWSTTFSLLEDLAERRLVSDRIAGWRRDSIDSDTSDLIGATLTTAPRMMELSDRWVDLHRNVRYIHERSPQVPAGELARAYLAVTLGEYAREAPKSWSRGQGRIPWNRNALPLLSLPSPVFWGGEAISEGDWAEVKIDDLHWSLLSALPLDLEVRPDLAFPRTGLGVVYLPRIDELNKLKAVGDAIWALIGTTEVQEVRFGDRHRVAVKSNCFAPDAYGHVLLSAQAIAQETIDLFEAVLWTTDGGIIPAEVAPHWQTWLKDRWHLDGRIIQTGRAHIHGPRHTNFHPNTKPPTQRRTTPAIHHLHPLTAKERHWLARTRELAVTRKADPVDWPSDTSELGIDISKHPEIGV